MRQDPYTARQRESHEIFQPPPPSGRGSSLGQGGSKPVHDRGHRSDPCGAGMCPGHRSNGPGRLPIVGDERVAERVTMSDHLQPVRIQRDERTVVVGVDGSEHSRMALKWAADEAARRGSLLKIICAFVKEPKNVTIWYEPGSFDLSPGEAIV